MARHGFKNLTGHYRILVNSSGQEYLRLTDFLASVAPGHYIDFEFPFDLLDTEIVVQLSDQDLVVLALTVGESERIQVEKIELEYVMLEQLVNIVGQLYSSVSNLTKTCWQIVYRLVAQHYN